MRGPQTHKVFCDSTPSPNEEDSPHPKSVTKADEGESDDLETIVRARKCIGSSGTNCSTVFISEYRYEIGIVYSDALQWYFIVTCLRGAGQLYYYLRISMLLKFCFNLVSNDVGDSTRPQQSIQVRAFKACVLLLKMPVQAIIFGSPLPIVCYASAHAIDSAITYEVISNIFNSQNGLFQLKFKDLCTVGFNQMRSVWLLALALHAFVQLRASAQRRLSWQPINGIQGVPEFLLSALAGVTMMAQIRIKSLRDSRITSFFEIVETQRLQAIKYQHNLGHHEYGHVTLGGVFIDFKFFVLLIALIYLTLVVRRVWRLNARKFRYQVDAPSLQTKTPVSYAAGVLWPVGAMCVHWASDYFCVKSPSSGIHSDDRTSWKPSSSMHGDNGTSLSASTRISSFAMTSTTFRSIQTLMKSLHARDDDVDASIAFMNLVAMSDPVVYMHYIQGSRGKLLGYYQSRGNPTKVFLLPCEVVNGPNWHLHNLELLQKVWSSDLNFADLIHCG
ncbi:hypothetical protein Gpo141_00013248 [Globisporangium polare]